MLRLEKGITTLASTSKDVAELKENLLKTLVIVQEKGDSVAELIAKIGVERKKVPRRSFCPCSLRVLIELCFTVIFQLVQVEDQEGLAAVEARKAKVISSSIVTFRANPP